eukprot:5683957-Amphidinium_carterae.1
MQKHSNGKGKVALYISGTFLDFALSWLSRFRISPENFSVMCHFEQFFSGRGSSRHAVQCPRKTYTN